MRFLIVPILCLTLKRIMYVRADLRAEVTYVVFMLTAFMLIAQLGVIIIKKINHKTMENLG